MCLDLGYSIEPHIDTEKLFVEIGETINLTCYLNTKEVDWHFKDKNLTTTIISNGLQLQVSQPIIFDFENFDETIDETEISDNPTSIFRMQRGNGGQKLKYRVTSDLHFTHLLTVYVQGAQDEGSYQCIDSISESPVKKTIMVILSNKKVIFKIKYKISNFNFLKLWKTIQELSRPDFQRTGRRRFSCTFVRFYSI